MHGCLSLIHARIHTNKLPIRDWLSQSGICGRRNEQGVLIAGISYALSLIHLLPVFFFLPIPFWRLLRGLLHINTLAHSAGSARSSRDNQSMRERYWLGHRGQLFSRSLSWEGNPLSRNNLSSYKRAPRQLYSHLHSSVANSRRLQGWCLSLKTFTFLEVQHKTRVHRFLPLFSECLQSCPGS